MHNREIDFSNLTPTNFENLCFELIDLLGFEKIKWRRGGPDKGRDIEGFLSIQNNLVGRIYEKWFFECKHHAKGVNSSVLDSKIISAKSENIDHLVFMISSYLTKDTRDWIEKVQNQLNYKLHVIEGVNLKSILSKHPSLLSSYNLLGNAQELINSIKKQWVVFDILPTFDALMSTFELGRENYNANDLALTICFLLNQENVNHYRFDDLYKLIDEAINILFEDVKEFSNTSVLRKKNIIVDFPGCEISFNIDKSHLIDDDDFSSEHLMETLFITHEIQIQEKKSLTDAYYCLLIKPIECIEILIYKESSCIVQVKKMIREECNNELKYIFNKLGRNDYNLITTHK